MKNIDFTCKVKYKIIYIEDDKDDFFALKMASKSILNDTDLVWINSLNSLMELKVQAENVLLILLDYHFVGLSAKNLIQYFRGISENIEIALLTSLEENSIKESMKNHGIKHVFNKNKLENFPQFVTEKKLLRKSKQVDEQNTDLLVNTSAHLDKIEYYQQLIPNYYFDELYNNANPQLLLYQNYQVIGFNQKANHLFESNLKNGRNFLKIISSDNALIIEDKIKNSTNESVSFACKLNNSIYKLHIHIIESNAHEKIYAISFIKYTSNKHINSIYIDPIKNSQLLIENSKSIVFQLNKIGEVIYLSDSYENITGYEKGDLLQKKLGINQNESLQEKVRNVFIKFAKGEIKEITDYTISETKDKKIIYYRYRAESILDEYDNFIGVYGVFTDVTDVIQASESLKKTEDSLDLIINNINEVVFILDNKTRINFITPNSIELTGYTAEELKEKRFIDFIHPDDYSNIINKFMKQKLPGNIINNKGETITARFKTKNGAYIYLETIIKKIENNNGKEINYIGSSRNVDGKIAANLILEEKKKYLEIITEIQNYYIETKDKKETFDLFLKRILDQTNSEFGFMCEVYFDKNKNKYERSNEFCNMAWNQISGAIFEKSEFKGDKFRNINAPLEKVLIEEKLIKYNPFSNKGLSVSGDIIPGLPHIQTFVGIPIFRNKKIVAVLGLARNYEEYSNDLIGKLEPILGIIVSIIEQNKIELAIKNTQLELSKSEAKVKAILTSIDDIIMEVNHEFIISNIWTKNTKIMLVPTEQMIGKKLNSFIGRYPFIQNIYDNLVLLSQDGIPRKIEFPMNLKGEILWRRASIYTLTENPEKLYCLQISDITTAKNAEENLKQNLIHEKELAELKSRFVTLTSHEFRTPLTSISSSNELVAMHLKKAEIPVGDKLSKYIDNIQNQVKHMSDLVNDVIKIGKIDADKMTLNMKELNMNEAIEEIMDNLLSTYKIPRKIKTKIIGKPYGIMMDIKILEHILENIANNAFKYSPQRPDPILEIDFQSSQVVLALQDYGIGIPIEDQSQLFEHFFRASNVGKINGVGLGLVIVKTLIDSLQGDLKIDSKEGKGTRVIIKFYK